jgi:TPR repeat protein
MSKTNTPHNTQNNGADDPLADWKAKAAAGDVESQCLLGFIYQRGLLDTGTDHSEAVKWFTLAAEQKNPEALLQLSRYYFEGLIVERDDIKGLELLTAAADAGDAEALCQLGIYYEQGNYVKQSFSEAARLYRLAAEQENAEDEDVAQAQCFLSTLLVFGHGVKENVKEGMQWLCKSADANYAPAHLRLGRFYLDGYNVEKNLKTAWRHFLAAAEHGESEAQTRLGEMYLHDKDDDGIGIDYEKAAKWFHLAAAQNDNEIIQHAQYRLGNLYERGDGVGKDLVTAMQWYHLSAAQGYKDAHAKLGWAYLAESGVKKNVQTALYHLNIAIEGDKPIADAYGNLSTLYKHGDDGVEPDYQKSFEYLVLGAENGDSFAQYKLGVCYEEGDSAYQIFPDIKQAIEWYSKAAEQGEERAAAALKRLGVNQ